MWIYFCSIWMEIEPRNYRMWKNIFQKTKNVKCTQSMTVKLNRTSLFASGTTTFLHEYEKNVEGGEIDRHKWSERANYMQKKRLVNKFNESIEFVRRTQCEIEQARHRWMCKVNIAFIHCVFLVCKPRTSFSLLREFTAILFFYLLFFLYVIYFHLNFKRISSNCARVIFVFVFRITNNSRTIQ